MSRCTDPTHKRNARGACIEKQFQPRLPSAPLIEARPKAVNAGCNNGYGSMGGLKSALTRNQERAYHRAIRDGTVTLFTGDELACALGYHPYEIWHDLWWTVDEDEAV